MAVKINIKPNSGELLPTIEVGRASAFEATISGVPSHLENVQISFGSNADTVFNAVTCDAHPGGEFGVYASGAYFLAEGRNHYHVTARTPRGDSIYLGGGALFVRPSVLNVPESHVPVIPDDLWVRGRNGLYYRVTADVDADGVPYMIVDKKGVTK